MTSHHHIRIGVALAVALGASAPPASAMINRIGVGAYAPTSSHVSSRPTATSGEPSSQLAIVRTTGQNGGFDWGDAGIGAAGGIALSMAGIGGALTVSQHRSRRARSGVLTN